MSKKYLPVKVSKTRCFLLLGVFLCLYFMDNLPIASFIGYNLYNNYLKPALWLGIALTIWKLPRIRYSAKLRFRQGLILWAFSFAVIYIFISIGAGLIDGFGKSPYNHSFKGMLTNIFVIGSALIGCETLRSYVVNSMTHKKVNYFVFLLISILITICNFSTNIFTGLKGIKDIVVFFAQFFAPEFSHNLMATYLAFLGGTIPAITYTGILQAFHWLSPVLPNLKWITTALIGILCPVFFLLSMQNIYLKESGTYPKKDKREDSIASWMITSLVSIFVIWFAVGVFPVYPSVIATGSMEPMIKPGDVILIDKSVDKSKLNVGDIIQFRRDNILISHRIVEIIDDDIGKGYLTKGDNNSARDSNVVRLDKIKGKLIKVVPKVGWLTLLIKSERDIQLDGIEF
ncbi:MAG TPA: signal peptidase I [Clostridiales bacterium]|nr:signal peptidase I [Clostridiales bacterium]